MTKKLPLTISLLILFVFLVSSCASSDALVQDKPEEETKAQKESSGDIKPYEEIITGDAESDPGLFTVHRVHDKVYFEIPDSMLNRDMLIVSRRAAMSSSNLEQMVAGERPTDPLMVRWEKAPGGQHILLRKVTTRNRMRFTGDDSSFKNAVGLQTLDPILISFPIEAIGPDSASSVIDIERLFLEDIKELTPFRSGGILVALGVKSPKKYIFEEERSFIKSTQSFGKNIEVRSMMTYTEAGEIHVYSILMHRSMILLPENPMRPRLADERIGHFAVNFRKYDESNPVALDYYIKRWRLEIPEESIDEFKNGELVEPEEKITFYIDPSTPEKWRKYIKQGVEDWLPAFEAAGFKNAIQAKPAPVDDPGFHPEDIRYSVIRYAASDIPNARGPSVADPRTGEILESDIILYHNVLKLLRDWRFSQTAANDPGVRTTDIPDEIIGRGLRYVVAHEVGHALGLRHNMGASKAFSVDSLRSASFTQKYGITPSIMDYARFNYVAQPQDQSVKLTPPTLGVYDKYAIKWAYRPILNADDAFEEVDTLNSWIEEHAGDPAYYFGEGDLSGRDPTSLRESLGDDIVKASRYGVKNTKYIIRHLDDWLSREGETYSDMENLYSATLEQYDRYLSHVGKLIAGVHLRRPRQGRDVKMYSYISEDKQREAVQFLLKQYRELPEWLVNKELQSKLTIVDNGGMIRRITTPANYIEDLYYSSLRADLINDGKLMFLLDNKIAHPENAYTPLDLFNDIRRTIFKEAIEGEKPDYYEKLLQNVYVNWLLDDAHLDNTLEPQQAVNDRMVRRSGVDYNTSFCSFGYPGVLAGLRGTPEFDKAVQIYARQHGLYFQYIDLKRHDKETIIESLILAEVKRVKEIVEEAGDVKDAQVRAHYDYLLRRINIFLNPDL